jgi:hypothetical protein
VKRWPEIRTAAHFVTHVWTVNDSMPSMSCGYRALRKVLQ